MKTAIIEFFEGQFNTESIMAMNNDERIAWANSLSEVDREYYEVNYDLDEFLYNLNCGPLSADWKVVSFQYSKIEDGKFVLDKCDDVYNISTRFSAKMYECEHSVEERQDVANHIYNIVAAKFGTDIKVDIYGYWNDVTDYRFDVYVSGDKCMILNNIQHFCNEVEDIKGISFCELQWSMDGSDINQVTFEGDEEQWLSKVSEPIHIVHDQEAVDEAIERANADLASFIEIIRNCKSLREVYDIVNAPNFPADFGSAYEPDGEMLDINYKSICLTVCSCEEGIYVSNFVYVYDNDGNTVWEGDLDEQGATGVQDQVDGRIYLEPNAPTEEKLAEQKPKTVYEQFKDECLKFNDHIVLMAIGDFFETYDEQAEVVAMRLGIQLSSRNSDGHHHYIAGFPKSDIDKHLAKLIRNGYKVALRTAEGTTTFPDKEPEPEQSTKDDESEENGIIDDAYYLESDDDELCLYINDDFYLHVVVDAEYDQWSYALYDTRYRLLTKDWTCGIDMSTWMSVLKNVIKPLVGNTIYCVLPHSPKLFKHQKNA